MAAKPNPILESYARKLNAQHMQDLGRHLELDRIALLLMLNDTLSVGPGRAGTALNDFMAQKMELAEAIVADSEDDKSITFTRHQLAVRIKQILGPEAAERFRSQFPLLREYWD